MTMAACRSGTKARAWSSLPMILSLQRRSPRKSPRKLIGAAAISAEPSRTRKTVNSASTARAAAPRAYLLPKRMMNSPASGRAYSAGAPRRAAQRTDPESKLGQGDLRRVIVLVTHRLARIRFPPFLRSHLKGLDLSAFHVVLHVR